MVENGAGWQDILQSYLFELSRMDLHNPLIIACGGLCSHHLQSLYLMTVESLLGLLSILACSD